MNERGADAVERVGRQVEHVAAQLVPARQA